MFQVPDWETDVPKSNVVFTKKANNKKFKAESTDDTSINNFVKNPQSIPQFNAKPIIGNGTGSTNKKKPKKRKLNNNNGDNIFRNESEGFEFEAKALVSNGTTSPYKKKKPKRNKLNNNIEDNNIFKKESKGFEFEAKPIVSNGASTPSNKKKLKKFKLNNNNQDKNIFKKESDGVDEESLVNTRKNKLNQNYYKDDCEQDAKESAKSNSPKKNKKLKLGFSNAKSDDTPPPNKRKHSNDEEIDRITVKAKKIKLNEKGTAENESTKRKKQKFKNIIEQRHINENEQKSNSNNEKPMQIISVSKVVSKVKQINNDAKKKEKFKKVLEQRTPINMTGNNLRERMLDRLKAAQFRYLNEKLYTSSGNEAQMIFQEDPSAFRTYHLGYQLQVKKWPVNPLDVIVKKIQKMPKTYVIADMGCGEAALSKRVPNKVHSFDLVSSAPGVVECDMARTPLLRESTDVVVYCLALMGTELTQYLMEANRVLKIGGQLLIAEVESRFDDVNSFVKEVERLGFKLKTLDKQHSVFFFMHFVKVNEPPVKKNKLPQLSLKPCIYKRR
ncbi:hypothetical protein O0L34_g18434 [Tuta absoluta]|nr:hypothetical protein O0L34_g18434 [Tuta absoluta]